MVAFYHAILKQGEAGMAVSDICREHGISNATFYNWRSKYGGMDASLMSEMKAKIIRIIDEGVEKKRLPFLC